jgi:hypothetical protein
MRTSCSALHNEWMDAGSFDETADHARIAPIANERRARERS